MALKTQTKDTKSQKDRILNRNQTITYICDSNYV